MAPPRWLKGKESASQCGRCKRCTLDPWVGKIPYRSVREPTPVLLGESHGQRSLAGYSPRVAQSQTWLKWCSTHASTCTRLPLDPAWFNPPSLPGTAMPLSQSSCIYSHLVPPPGRVAFLNAHLIRVCFYIVSLYDLRCFVRTRALRDPACGLPGPDTLPGPTVPPPSRGSLHSNQADFDCVAPCSSKWHYSQDFASGPLYMISQNLTSFSCKPEQYISMEKLFYKIIITLKVSLPCILSPSMIFVIPSSLVQSTTSLKPSLNAKVSLGSSFFLYNSIKICNHWFSFSLPYKMAKFSRIESISMLSLGH